MRAIIRHIVVGQNGPLPLLQLSGSDEFAEISRALGQAAEVLKEVVENIHELIWVAGPDLKAIYLSPAFEKIWMRRREELKSVPGQLPDYILKEYHPMIQEAYATLLNGAPMVQVEYRAVRGDGQTRWVENRAFPIRDASGKVYRFVGIVRDITDRKTLQEQIVNVSEQERQSLGADLHDDACQRLAAMKLKGEALTTLLQRDQSPHSALARDLTAQIAGMSALLRNIARGLAPVEVEGDGLVLALRKLVEMQEAIHEVPCFFIEEQPVVVSNKIVATHLYRIVQELITNAARHGAPGRIEVRVSSLRDHILLVVLNDGDPFRDPSADHNGMGLKIIRHRASAIGATINIRARTDGTPGTIAECLVSHDLCLAADHSAKPTLAGVDAPGI